MESQILHAWQPKELTKFKMKEGHFYRIGLVDTKIGSEALTITLENESQILEIIYDQIDLSVPIVNYVWNFRYGTESSVRLDLNEAKRTFPTTLNKEAYYMFKVQNSDFIKWNDRVCPFKSTDYPQLEHHLFLTSDDIIETLSIFEPKFIVKDK